MGARGQHAQHFAVAMYEQLDLLSCCCWERLSPFQQDCHLSEHSHVVRSHEQRHSACMHALHLHAATAASLRVVLSSRCLHLASWTAQHTSLHVNQTTGRPYIPSAVRNKSCKRATHAGKSFSIYAPSKEWKPAPSLQTVGKTTQPLCAPTLS